MKCPICKEEAIKKFFPFCSHQCKMVDLYNWFNGEYGIPTEETKESEEDKCQND